MNLSRLSLTLSATCQVSPGVDGQLFALCVSIVRFTFRRAIRWGFFTIFSWRVPLSSLRLMEIVVFFPLHVSLLWNEYVMRCRIVFLAFLISDILPSYYLLKAKRSFFFIFSISNPFFYYSISVEIPLNGSDESSQLTTMLPLSSQAARQGTAGCCSSYHRI